MYFYTLNDRNFNALSLLSFAVLDFVKRYAVTATRITRDPRGNREGCGTRLRVPE